MFRHCIPLVLMFIAASPVQAEKPNILFFLADDLTYTDLGFLGHPDVRTPVIDRFREQGMLLSHAFTASAMCSPTRHAIYTGLQPVRSGAYPNHAFAKEGVRSITHYLGEAGFRVGLAGKSHVAPKTIFDFETISNKKLDFEKIGEFINRDQSPFALVVASKQPHTPWDLGDASQYDENELTLPGYLADTPETRETLTKYYAEVTYLDWQFGEVLRILDESGKADNTLVIFCTEQGASVPYAKWTLYDAGIRGTVVARWPGTIESGSSSDALIQYVDFLPTWLEAVDRSIPETLDGRSFMPVLRGASDVHNEYVYALHTTVGINYARHAYPIRAIRDARYKLIWNINHTESFTNTLTEANRCEFWDSWVEYGAWDATIRKYADNYTVRPEFEFFDLRVDPEERVNLANSPEHRARIESMKSALNAWMKKQGDDGMPTELEAPLHQVRPRSLEKTRAQ